MVPRPSPAPDAVRGIGSRQSSLREANLALVVRTVLGAPAPPSRATVAQRTALTRSTVSRLVDDLVLAGVLAELDPPRWAELLFGTHPSLASRIRALEA